MSNDFEYNYKAPTKEERMEIESIRNSYIPKDEPSNKMERLRKLDFKVKNLPVAFSIAFGVIGSLIFGLGLAMILEWNIILWGILVGVVGFFITILAYPVYKFITQKLKNKYSEEIIKLSDELLNN